MKRFSSLASLQSRLLVLVLGLVTLVWLAAAVTTWYDARHELDELLDSHLTQAAALLVMHQDGDEDDLGDVPLLHKYAPRVAFQVFMAGKLMTRSSNAAILPMSTATEGFDTVRFSDGSQWRVFAAKGPAHDVQVFVAEQTGSRQTILWAILRSVLWPLLIALPLIALAVWWAVRQGLEPLRRLSGALVARQPGAIEPVAADGGTPSEIAPLIQALNALFERMAQLIDAERRFTADAAHELRTPIAAIRTQAQVALAAGDDAATRQHALQFTLAGCDRATRLVEQLLMLSRLEASPPRARQAATVDLSALARRVAADLAPAALARRQVLELEAPQPCPVAVNEMLAGVLLRNLMDNALRYSPDGATILASLHTASGQTVFKVEDSGPGMTDAAMSRLGERFYRMLGSDQPGSGLGWSIVKRIARAEGADIQVARSSGLGGLLVVVTWH